MITKVLVATLVIELLTIISRTYFGSVQKKFKKSKFKYKVRIHHGYIGATIALTAYFAAFTSPLFQENLMTIGLSLLISDALHHFIVLPVWVGQTEFP